MHVCIINVFSFRNFILIHVYSEIVNDRRHYPYHQLLLILFRPLLKTFILSICRPFICETERIKTRTPLRCYEYWPTHPSVTKWRPRRLKTDGSINRGQEAATLRKWRWKNEALCSATNGVNSNRRAGDNGVGRCDTWATPVARAQHVKWYQFFCFFRLWVFLWAYRWGQWGTVLHSSLRSEQANSPRVFRKCMQQDKMCVPCVWCVDISDVLDIKWVSFCVYVFVWFFVCLHVLILTLRRVFSLHFEPIPKIEFWPSFSSGHLGHYSKP